MPFTTCSHSSPAGILALILSVVFGGSFSAAAAGSVAVAPSGNDLILSLETAASEFYAVQGSPNLLDWTNCPFGIPGDGAVKSVTVTNATSSSQGFYRFLAVQPAGLVLPQSTAFEILGYWCGGIEEQVSAGFDVVAGFPSGVVNLSTTCSGSGRDGGRSTTHTASAVVTWDFTGNVISAIALTNGVSVSPTASADGMGDFIFSSGTSAYLVVPVPEAPTAVTAVQSGDQWQISWTPKGVNQAAVTSSTLTAIPLNSAASVLTNTVTGPATNGAILALEPQTTYQISVVSRTVSGSSPASSPIAVTTSPATILPSAPTGVTAIWGNPDPSGTTDTLVASWLAADPGNSPIDEYQIKITGSDGGGMLTQMVSGTTLTTYFTVDSTPNWAVTVQAHNAAGWGPVSTAFDLGGL